jgi:MoaA/NifB/PqqE/SkfB family radical SAM enzyme
LAHRRPLSEEKLMGFPKPWPTQWPDPEVEVPPEEPPAPGEPYAPWREPEEPGELPEFRSRFFSATWAITHPCNLRCTHCYDVVPEPRHDLDTAQALRVVDRLADAGVRFIAFSGGEPFLRRDVFDLMARARARGMGIATRSNGTRIDSTVANRLRALDAAVVGISFDGARAETHDAVRGAGAFAGAVAGIRALHAAGVRAQMEVVLSRRNAPEALDFVRLGEDLGVAEVNFSALTPNGRGKALVHEWLDPTLAREVGERLRTTARGASVAVTPNCALAGPCVANFEPHVTCDGWMTPCYLSTHRLLNVLDTPPEAIAVVLHATRIAHLDGCGRARWHRREATRPRALPVIA